MDFGGSPSNGGLLYHEVQESKLCAVHCVNTVLQGPFFTELDLAALASDLDHKEREVIVSHDQDALSSHDFLSEDSHNVSMDGDFSIQVSAFFFLSFFVYYILLQDFFLRFSSINPTIHTLAFFWGGGNKITLLAMIKSKLITIVALT